LLTTFETLNEISNKFVPLSSLRTARILLGTLDTEGKKESKDDVELNYQIQKQGYSQNSERLQATLNNKQRRVIESIYQAGQEFRVNTYVTSDQEQVTVSDLNDRTFVVVWQSLGQDGSNYGIYGQHYTFSGNKIGSEFQVNTYISSDQINPSIGKLKGNGFVIIWQSNGQDANDYGVYGQRYNLVGNKIGNEFQINTYTTSYQGAADISSLDNGGLVMVWQSLGQDGSNNGIYGQAYDAQGNRVGNEFQINTYTTLSQSYVSVTSLINGGFVVIWMSDGQDGNARSVYGQLYNSTYHKANNEFRVNTAVSGNQWYPNVASLDDGGFLVVFMNPDGGNDGIYGQRYDSKGNKIKQPFPVNTYISNNQWYPVVSRLNKGGFVVVWQSQNPTAASWSIYGQLYDSLGLTVGEEFEVSNNINASQTKQTKPAVSSLADDGFVVIWQSENQDGSGYGIYGRIFTPISRFPYEYILIVCGLGACALLTTSVCIAISGTGIYITKKRQQLKAKEEEVKLLESKFELGNFLINYKVDYNQIKLLDYLGAGAFASVYRAKWENKTVAYKVFSVMEQKQLKEFEAEARIMLESNYPNIVRLYGVCIKQGSFALLMEYMPMGSLKTAMQKKTIPFTWESKWNIAYDIASVLKFLHGKGVVHRDIKTDNILLYKEGQEIHAKVADFGLSKQQKTDESATTGIGTYKYMAPEMLLGDERYPMGHMPMEPVDIYALGMTYVALITEAEPYPNVRSHMHIPSQVAKGKLKLALPEKNCPFLFFNLTNRCRSIQPDNRPSAEKIVEELEGMKQQMINFNPKTARLFSKPKGKLKQKPPIIPKSESYQQVENKEERFMIMDM